MCLGVWKGGFFCVTCVGIGLYVCVLGELQVCMNEYGRIVHVYYMCEGDCV